MGVYVYVCMRDYMRIITTSRGTAGYVVRILTHAVVSSVLARIPKMKCRGSKPTFAKILCRNLQIY